MCDSICLFFYENTQMPRFEVVSEPFEDRLQKGLTFQIHSTITTFHSVLNTISNNTNHAIDATASALSDHALVSRVSSSSIELLSPRSLPGFLFSIAILIRIVRAVAVSRMAHAAVRRQYASKVATD